MMVAVPLTLLNTTEFPLAKCMDGTPAGFYLARNASSPNWIFELEGGGECRMRPPIQISARGTACS